MSTWNDTNKIFSIFNVYLAIFSIMHERINTVLGKIGKGKNGQY